MSTPIEKGQWRVFAVSRHLLGEGALGDTVGYVDEINGELWIANDNGDWLVANEHVNIGPVIHGFDEWIESV